MNRKMLKRLFDYTSRSYSIVPGVTWDIFNAGRISSNVHVQNARQVEALQALSQGRPAKHAGCG